jgi:superfamily I DNA/RNA helicase
MVTVAIASEFLDAFARIPRAQQRKVREFTEKFRANPKSPGINYEKIHAVKDEKVRTVRIDQKYRAVVLHPTDGEVYVLVWVDNHDEAMDWAGKRRFEVNPVTGSLQVFSVSEAEQVVAPEKKKKAEPGLLDAYADDVLLSFGVPSALLPSVRAVKTQDGLLSLLKHLPAEAAEALTWLGEGLPVDEVQAAVTVTPIKAKVDTGDLVAALENTDTKRRFVTIKSQDDLSAILNAPLEKWRVFLHPSQEKLVTKKFNGPARVLGGPGTGKTVAAMHRARFLAKTVFAEKTDRILFTTYTANLAESVEQHLRGLCSEEMERIEVVHLHAWAVRFMKTQKVDFQVASDEEIEQSWEEAQAVVGDPSFDTGFLRQEWAYVVQANGITTMQEYLQVPRTGRGRTLTKPQRGKIWKIFEEYRSALKDKGKHEWLFVIQETRQYLEKKKSILPYRAVVVDESQDFHPEEWKLIRALVPEGPNDLFLVGDAHQRIYGRKVVLKDCGIQIQGRSSQLKINYRTTEQIRNWSMAVLQGVQVDDLDGEEDRVKGYRSLLSGQLPEVRRFDTPEAEGKFLVAAVTDLLKHKQAEEICLVARTSKLLDERYQPLFKAANIPNVVLEKKNDPGQPGVRLATMHRVKGLEFPVMILAAINSHIVPIRAAFTEADPTAKAEHEERERSLLFVAATRARDHLIVTAYGAPSPYLSQMLRKS